MLRALRLGNFKAFGATQRVPLKPLTLVFGPNSAGKSSLIHGLALAHEAGRTGNLDIFRTDIGGNSIDLGGFRQYVFRRDPSLRVEWSAEIDTAGLPDLLDMHLPSVGTATVSATIGVPLNDLGAPVAGRPPSLVTYEILGDDETLLRMSQRGDGQLQLDRLAIGHPVLRRGLEPIAGSNTAASGAGNGNWEAIDKAIESLIPQLRAKAGHFLPDGIMDTPEMVGIEASGGIVSPLNSDPPPQDLTRIVNMTLPQVLNALVRGLNDAVGEQIERLQYLGPLRSYPPRHLAFSGHDDANWRAGGGYAWGVLLRDSKVCQEVNKWLGADWLKTHYEILVRDLIPLLQMEQPLASGIEDMADNDGLGMELDYDSDGPTGHYPVIKDPEAEARRIVRRIGESDIERTPDLVLVDRRTDTVVSHRDVGIGVSQILPVLVTCYGLRNQIVAIEQPEIHLHPALQAELGDVFIQSALGGNANTFVLETHSEHLILRIMRRIRDTAKGKLPAGVPAIKPDDVSVLFVEPTKAGAIVRPIELDADGEFADLWPGGFFEEGFRERFS